MSLSDAIARARMGVLLGANEDGLTNLPASSLAGGRKRRNPAVLRLRRRLATLTLGLSLAATSALDPGDAAAQAYPGPTAVELRTGRARLDFLAGDWRIEQFTPVEAGGWLSNGEADLRFASTMNDLYLETNARSGRYIYHIVFSFDAAQQQYRVASRDDQSGLIDVYEGVFDERGALVLSNVGPGTHYSYGGARYHNRMIFSPTTDGWIWLVEASNDNGQTWRPQVRVVARRPA